MQGAKTAAALCGVLWLSQVTSAFFFRNVGHAAEGDGRGSPLLSHTNQWAEQQQGPGSQYEHGVLEGGAWQHQTGQQEPSYDNRDYVERTRPQGHAIPGEPLRMRAMPVARLPKPKLEVVERIMADRPRKAKFTDVRSCNFCEKCALTDRAEDVGLANGQIGGSLPFFAMEPTVQRPDSEVWRQYAPQVDSRQGLPNCTKCQGCDTLINDLETMAVHFKGSSMTPTAGRSRSVVYRVSSPQAEHGIAIGKILCLPFSKTERDGREKLEPCDDKFKAFLRDKQYPVVNAAQKIARECGLDVVAPRTWIQNITALMPETGYVIESEMMMQDLVKGISLNSVHRHMSDRDGEDLFSTINSTTVILGAIHDLLLANEDRHNDNILIDDKGHIALIDSDKVLGLDTGVPQSIFFPTSIYMWYNLFGRAYINSSFKDASHKLKPNYNLMLDYRCHVSSVNGPRDSSFTLGTNYPPQVKQCLRSMDAMRADEILTNYGMPDLQAAETFKSRVTDMLNLGFERALEIATPFCKRLPWTKPCCSWKGSSSHSKEQCADTSWHPDAWKKMNCKKVDDGTHHYWEEIHSKRNWEFVWPDQHEPSLREAAIHQQL